MNAAERHHLAVAQSCRFAREAADRGALGEALHVYQRSGSEVVPASERTAQRRTSVNGRRLPGLEDARAAEVRP